MKFRLFDSLIGRGQIDPRSDLELGLLARNGRNGPHVFTLEIML